jgi:hypothetical protein
MQYMHNLIILDVSAAVLLVVLAHLSMRLGAALKVRPYFRLFHFAAVLVLTAAFLGVVSQSLPQEYATVREVVPMGLRCLAGCLAVGTALRYWKWLFAEYFKL